MIEFHTWELDSDTPPLGSLRAAVDDQVVRVGARLGLFEPLKVMKAELHRGIDDLKENRSNAIWQADSSGEDHVREVVRHRV